MVQLFIFVNLVLIAFSSYAYAMSNSVSSKILNGIAVALNIGAVGVYIARSMM